MTATQEPAAMPRFRVRRRADGWAVYDGDLALTVATLPTEARAAKEAERRNNEGETRTYGVVWYCEVDAASPEEAEAKARRYLAPSYRENWAAQSVEHVE